jgi:hypothetical protein
MLLKKKLELTYQLIFCKPGGDNWSYSKDLFVQKQNKNNFVS